MLEKDIERKVCEYARSKGCLAYKFTSPNRVAVPDRLFIYKGQVWFIEFKAQGKKPTVPQLREHSILASHCFDVFVIDDVGQGKFCIDVQVAKANT
jgi:hypothetical protein